ncbi:hypothetical protein ABT218_34695, partial [Streptomyces sp. NPDC001455]
MGRHSRKGPERAGPDTDAALAKATDEGLEGVRPGPGSGRRRRPTGAEGHVSFQQAAHVRGGHPEHQEPGGGWGAGPGTGRPADGERPAPRRPMGQARTAERAEKAGRAQGAPPSARPAGTKPLIPGPRREFVEAFDPAPTPPPPRGGGGPTAGRGVLDRRPVRPHHRLARRRPMAPRP